MTELPPHVQPLKTMKKRRKVTAAARSAELARAVSALAAQLVSLRQEVAVLREELAAQAAKAEEREALLRAKLLAIAEALRIV